MTCFLSTLAWRPCEVTPGDFQCLWCDVLVWRDVRTINIQHGLRSFVCLALMFQMEGFVICCTSAIFSHRTTGRGRCYSCVPQYFPYLCAFVSLPTCFAGSGSRVRLHTLPQHVTCLAKRRIPSDKWLFTSHNTLTSPAGINRPSLCGAG